MTKLRARGRRQTDESFGPGERTALIKAILDLAPATARSSCSIAWRICRTNKLGALGYDAVQA